MPAAERWALGGQVGTLRHVTILLAFFSVFGGCTDADRYERTPLEQWVTRNLTGVGATLETPMEIDPFWIHEYEHVASIGMHVVRPPFGVLADARPMISLGIKRIPGDSFENVPPDTSLAYKRATPEERATFDALFNIKHLNTVRIGGDTGLVYFRRDVPCPDGEILSATATWHAGLSYDGVDHRVEDAAAIQRMLDSLQASW